MSLEVLNKALYLICGITAKLSIWYQHVYLSICRAAGYARSDRATITDFFLSLIPADIINFYLIATSIYGISQLYLHVNIPQQIAKIAALNFQSFMSGGILVVSAFWTAAIISGLLRYTATFWLQILAGTIALTLKIITMVMHQRALLPELPATLWAFTFLAATLCSNRSYWAHFFPFSASRRMRSTYFPPRQPGRFRVLLIEPAYKPDFYARTARRIRYPFTTPYLAALAPANWDPMIIDVIFDEIDYDIDTDVVAITSMAMNFGYVEHIARTFQAKGVTVIIGGADPSRQPETYMNFSDSVLVGAGEGYFSQMLSDWENSRLQKKYVNETVFDLKGMPLPRYDLLPLRRYNNWQPILVSTSCPYNCSFCAYNRTREPRLRPIEEVVKAIEATHATYFWFEAPELLVYKDYVRQLEKALQGKKVQWGTHATMKSCSDASVVKSAYAAGLRNILIGLESFNPETLAVFNKKMNAVPQYQAIFALLNKTGISVSVHLIFGCFTDKLEDFRTTLEGIIKGKVADIVMHIMTTYAGDEKFRAMLLANGAVEYQGSGDRKRSFTFYRSPNLSDLEMARGITGLMQDFYSPTAIFKRLCLRSIRNFPNFLPDLHVNVRQAIVRRGTTGVDFDFVEALSEYHDDLPEMARERVSDFSR